VGGSVRDIPSISFVDYGDAMISREQWHYVVTCKYGCTIWEHTDGTVRDCEHNAYRRWQLTRFFRDRRRTQELVKAIYDIAKGPHLSMADKERVL
jgi:hypothetical protein